MLRALRAATGDAMRVLAVSGLILLFSSAAFGESFTSDRYGFSADFPDKPTIGEPRGSETDAKGNFISTTVIIQTGVQGFYTAMVTVDSYVVPTAIDTPSTLRAMVTSFVSELDGTATSSRPGKLDGYRARFFTYDTPNHTAAGKGIAVVVPGKKPRTYLVLTMRTPLATDDEIADLDKFIASFHVK
jgi:hypothetical protein